MLPLVLYAVVSAVTVRNIGLLPDRSFRSRLLAVSFFLTVGFAVIFLTLWGVDEFLHSLPPPDGMVPRGLGHARLLPGCRQRTASVDTHGRGVLHGQEQTQPSALEPDTPVLNPSCTRGESTQPGDSLAPRSREGTVLLWWRIP